jgi:hypothetical protein
MPHTHTLHAMEPSYLSLSLAHSIQPNQVPSLSLAHTHTHTHTHTQTHTVGRVDPLSTLLHTAEPSFLTLSLFLSLSLSYTHTNTRAHKHDREGQPTRSSLLYCSCSLQRQSAAAVLLVQSAAAVCSGCTARAVCSGWYDECVRACLCVRACSLQRLMGQNG